MNRPEMQTSSGDCQRRVDHGERSLDDTQQSTTTVATPLRVRRWNGTFAKRVFFVLQARM